jgi:hypothetical protein
VTLPGQLVDDPRTQQELENIRKRFPLGGQDIATSAITATHIAPDAVGASELADNSVAQANMLDDSVGDAEILDSYIVSGSYSPTLTDITNVAASTDFGARYTRIGSIVQVTGLAAVDATTITTLTDLGISLPIASNFGAITDVVGLGTSDAVTETWVARASVADDRAVISSIVATAANHTVAYYFLYSII